MERLTLNRRQKTTGDKVDCIPAGDGLPVWSILSLDAKLPMMPCPKGSVLLYTTKLGEPKHQCKQERDFDLRDPNGKYASNEYQPLHDPHLKTHFKTNMMRRHLIKKGFISEDGKVLCSLKEFNQYRQYLRHIYFLEIAKERKEELEQILKQHAHDKAEVQKKISRGSIVRRRLQQQKETNTTKLKQYMERKSASLEKRLQQIRNEMTQKEKKQREEAERRQINVFKNQQEYEQRKLAMLRRMHQRDMMKRQFIEDGETQRKIRAEIKCMETWNARRAAQKEMLEHYEGVMKQDDEERANNINKREEMISKKWERLDKKIDHLKQMSKQKKQRKDEVYFKRLGEKLASGDYRIWSRRKERRRSPKKTFCSTWKLQDVLKTFEVPDSALRRRSDPGFMAMLNAAIDGAVDMVTSTEHLEDRHLKEQAHTIVHNVIERVKTDIYPHYLQMLDGENEALKSKSVRFSSDEEEIRAGLDSVVSVSSDSLTNEAIRLRPVSEHILTPCASQLELTKLEAEAILGSPDIADKTTSVSFVETLLLRLLDDLNSGRLSKEDIMKLASYSMDIIQSTETEKGDVIIEVPEESETEGAYLAASSSSIIAKKMVDFTLGKILNDIKSGNVHHDDLASLTISLLDNVGSTESSASVSISDTELEIYIEETLQRATSSAVNPREDSPVCEALLDDFLVVTLKSLIKDLEEEVLTNEQVQILATSVKEEARQILPSDSDSDVENREGVQKVLQDVLRQLQSGAIDFKTMYQVVFAISYSYNAIKTQPSVSAKKVMELTKDILFVVEQNAGHFEDVNLNIVHEANHRLSNADLDSKQVEDLSASIVCVVAKSKICNTEIAKDIVEDVLLKTKERVENNAMDAEAIQSVMDVAESVINTLQENRESPTYVDVFLDVLKQLKSLVENMGGIEDISGDEIDHLISQIGSNTINDDDVLEMAKTVARVVKSPIQSDSSFAATLAVKDCLKVALNDIKDGSIEDDFLHDIVTALKSVCKASESTARKTPAFLSSLAMFLRNILNHLTYRMQTGDLNEADIKELSDMFKNKLKGSQIESEKAESVEVNDPTQMLNFIQNFVNATEKGDLEATDAEEVGYKLIEFGRRLVDSFVEKSDKVCSPCTDIVAEDVVEEVIRTLQLEIDKGALSKESLKEMTKVIIESTSASDIASEVVAYTLKGINRDIERGIMPSQLHSLQTIQGSPSASTVASQIVKQTIESITRDIAQKGIPQEMLSSIATSFVTALSGDKMLVHNLPEELKRYRSTIANIIDCLRRDEVNQAYAEEIFCLILERYKMYIVCPEEERQEKPDQLSGDDVELVSNLVMETLHNVERSVAKGRMDNKAFSIPSLPHSEDTSVMAEDLINACLDNIRKDVAAERTMPVQPTNDLVEFILEIVTRLQSELADGTISNLSMAHFFQAISSEEIDMKTLEMNAAANLQRVAGDIRLYRGNSAYVHRILETYLAPENTADEVFGDPLKAIEAILVNVSSEILTKFVKATLQTILMGMREDSGHFHEKAPSAYVLRSASSIIAENVIKQVLTRVNSDMMNKVHKIHGTVSKQDIERAASRLHSESPRDPKKKSTTAVLTSKPSMSSVLSREVEDIVLETLHNIVANLRLEQSIKSQKGSRDNSSSNVSQEIEDFVLNCLQNILLDHQDRRSQMDMGVKRTESKYATSSIELVSGESKEATAYVNEVLQNVVQEIKAEMTAIGNKTSEDMSDADSPNIQTMILEYLQSAMADSQDLNFLDSGNELFSPEDVKQVLLETISGTISNIKDGRFSPSDLNVMYDATSRFFHEADLQMEVKEEEEVTAELVMRLLEQVKVKVETIDIQARTLNRISSQLVTLGMDVAYNESSSPDNIRSDSSVTSSLISDLVKDVLVRITKQLNEETRGADGEIGAVLEGNTNNNDEIVTDSPSKTSSFKNDVNYNRRMSASTVGSCASNVTSDTTKISKQRSYSNTNSENIKSKKSTSPQTKKPPRRSTESRPVIKQSKTPSKMEQVAKNSPEKSNQATRTTPTKRLQVDRSPKVTPSVEKSAQNGKKKSSKETTPKRTVKESISEKKTTIRKSLSPTLSSSTPIRKTKTNGKALPKVRTTNANVKTDNKRDNGDVCNKTVRPTIGEPPSDPLELKSVCGVHKTKISYREQSDSPTSNSDCGGSNKSSQR